MSCAPVNDSSGWRSSSKLRKASCFSAVRPVCGWNQCVKCVTHRLIAHSLMTCATVGAIWMAVVVEVEEGVVLLGGETGLRLEPVREVRHAPADRPFLDDLRDRGRDLDGGRRRS